MYSFSIVKFNNDTREYLQDLISCKLNQNIDYIYKFEIKQNYIEGFRLSLDQWRGRRRLPISLLDCFINSSAILVELDNKQKNTFIHTTHRDNLDNIYQTGKLLIKHYEDKYETLLGNAVYAHLANGGVYWESMQGDSIGIVFTTQQPGYIVVDTATQLNDCGIGEVLFENDVTLDNYRVVPEGEIKNLIRENFNWNYVNCYYDREYTIKDCDELQYHRYNINNEPLLSYKYYNTNPTLEITLSEFIFFMEIISNIRQWTHLHYQRTGILDRPIILKRYYDWVKVHKLDLSQYDLQVLEEL